MPCHARSTGPSAQGVQLLAPGSKQYVSLRYASPLRPHVMYILPSSVAPAWAYTWTGGSDRYHRKFKVWRHRADVVTRSLSYLSHQRGHKFPRVGVRVVALHRVQLAAVVPPSDGVNVTGQDADAVVGVLLLQGLDAAPAVVTGVVPGKHTCLR